MGLVGALVGVLTPIVDLDLIGTVYQESQTYYLLFAGLLAGHGRGRLLGSQAVGPAPARQGRRRPGRARA